MKKQDMIDKIEDTITKNVICLDASCIDDSILSKEFIVTPKWIAKLIVRELDDKLKSLSKPKQDL